MLQKKQLIDFRLLCFVKNMKLVCIAMMKDVAEIRIWDNSWCYAHLFYRAFSNCLVSTPWFSSTTCYGRESLKINGTWFSQVIYTCVKPTVSKHWQKLKAQTPNSGLASSFCHTSAAGAITEGHCCLHTGCLMPIFSATRCRKSCGETALCS